MKTQPLTYQQLTTMTPKAVWHYERSLGFIAKLYDAVVNADVIRKNVHEKMMRTWRASWLYDNCTQRNYARMIFRARGYLVYDAQCCVKGLPHSPELVTYLE